MRDKIYVYEFMFYPGITRICLSKFAPPEIAKMINEKLVRKFFLKDKSEVWINLKEVINYKVIEVIGGDKQ